jgi:hypothetical protein
VSRSFRGSHYFINLLDGRRDPNRVASESLQDHVMEMTKWSNQWLGDRQCDINDYIALPRVCMLPHEND